MKRKVLLVGRARREGEMERNKEGRKEGQNEERKTEGRDIYLNKTRTIRL